MSRERLRAGVPRSLLWIASLAFAFRLLTWSLHRGLNFDETLVLRAGYLALMREPAEPAFWMPWTCLVGGVGHLLSDPAHALRACRVLVVLLMGAALFRVGVRHGKEPVLVAVAAICWQQDFVTHGTEFRYDAAIIVGLLLSLSHLPLRSRRDAQVIGLLIAWLAAHHLKGVFYAGCLLPISALGLFTKEHSHIRWARLKEAGLTFGLAGGGWVGFCVLLGQGRGFMQTYTTFAALARSSTSDETSLSLWQSGEHNAVFWLAVGGLALASALTRSPDGKLQLRGDTFRDHALLFLVSCLVFAVLHPHGFRYLLAPVALFGALAGARGAVLCAARVKWPLLLGLVACALLIQIEIFGVRPSSAYEMPPRRSLEPQLVALRALRGAARPGDRVVDPSGLAYFLPPCNRQWYVDLLFSKWASQGRWMQDFDVEREKGCVWIVNTPRLYMLPQAARKRLDEAFPQPQSSGPLIYGGVRNALEQFRSPPGQSRMLVSYW